MTTVASGLVMQGLRTEAELIGDSAIKVAMRLANLAPQHNRRTVDRVVDAGGNSDENRAPYRSPVKIRASSSIEQFLYAKKIEAQNKAARK